MSISVSVITKEGETRLVENNEYIKGIKFHKDKKDQQYETHRIRMKFPPGIAHLFTGVSKPSGSISIFRQSVTDEPVKEDSRCRVTVIWQAHTASTDWRG